MIKLQRIGHILLNVRDVERSKAFYTDILGFKVLEQDPDHGGVFLSLGEYGNTLDLFPCANPDAYPQPKSGVGRREGLGVKHTAFAVASEEDLTHAYFALKDAGVTIYRAVDHTSQKSIYFYDPDDNLLEIVWERPNTREIFEQGRGDGDVPIEFERPSGEQLERLRLPLCQALKVPKVVDFLDAAAFYPVGSTPEEFRAFVAVETTRYARMIKEAKIPMQN